MNKDEKLSLLSKHLNSETFNAIVSNLKEKPDSIAKLTIGLLEKYILLLEKPLKTKNAKELKKSLLYIEIHICQNNKIYFFEFRI